MWMALASAMLTSPAEAGDRPQRRPAAGISYCGFGHGAADSAMQPGGGGDTLVIQDPEDIYHFVFDSSSPVSLQSHDRVIFTGIEPRELTFSRIGDHLVICHPERKYELVIDSHYCRAKATSPADMPNSEIEELAFVSAGEIWLADTLVGEMRATGAVYPPPGDHDYAAHGGNWVVRPFSQALPEWNRPAVTCP